jgi:hypothetical protein
MKNMSFALTTQQMEDETKDITRRTGWAKLKAGDLFQPVEKGMGLKKGETVKRVGRACMVVSVTPEPLSRMIDDPVYGAAECVREGFPHLSPAQFVDMFCKANKCQPGIVVNRIEFERIAR